MVQLFLKKFCIHLHTNMGTLSDEDRWFEVALQLVRQAGSVVREAYNAPRKHMNVETKSSEVDLVTETDQRVEEMLFHGLQKHFPNHRFIGEESCAAGAKVRFSNEPTWIIDPIDGTTNFVHRMPFVAISVGLTVGKQVRIGIIYNPIMDELFTARKGQGAYRNGFRIYTTKTKDVSQSVVISTIGSQRRDDVLEAFVHSYKWFMSHGVRGHRSLGSAALNMCYVAQGSADCYVEYGIHCWDIAAGAIIVEEAGGKVLDAAGGQFDMMSRRVLCASSEELATTLSCVLTHVDFPTEFESE